MRRVLSAVFRAGLALCLGGLVLALLRFEPVRARPPLPVRALPLALPTLIFGIGAALTGPARRAGRAAPALAGILGSGGALLLLVALRPPAGLTAEVATPAGLRATLPPGPIDLIGEDLEAWPRSRRWSVRWSGPLRAPRSGAYRLGAEGRGRVLVRIDERPVLAAEGERLVGAATALLGRGEHRLEVLYERAGPGARLRLSWAPPLSSGAPGPSLELIAPRDLGPPPPPLVWPLTDALAFGLSLCAAWLVLALPWDVRRTPPAPRPLGAGEVAASLGAHLLLAAAMSWPLVADLAGSGPVNRPDGRLNAWILAWDAHALLHQPGRLFQAPIFHPLPDALAFSENLLLPSILALPATVLGGPLLGYNLVFLLSAAASGLGAQLLVARVTRDAAAAFVGGAVFGVGVHRFVNIAHLHAQVTPFLPLALLAFDRFLARPTLVRALLVGGLLVLQGASSVYLGAITATLIAVAAVLAALGGLGGRGVLRLAAGFLLAALVLAPLARPYLRMRGFQGEEFTLETLRNYATTPESYLASLSPLYAAATRRHLDPERVHDFLFPGVLPLALGVAGLAAAPRRYAALAVIGSAVAFALSLGPETALYRFLHEQVVLFRGIRALGRFSIVPVLALAVLTGIALAGRRRLAAPALVGILAEACLAPIGFGRYTAPGEASRYLAGAAGAVAQLPLGEDDTGAMLEGIGHFRPLLNGDSGFMPRPYSRAMELLARPLGAGGLRLLRALQVRHVVAREDLALPLAARFGAERVYGVPAGEAARPVRSAPARPTLWTGDGAVLDLGAEQETSRVVFEVSEQPWVDAPRVGVSSDGREYREVVGQADLADATLSLYLDPRQGLGEVRLPPQRARFLRLDPRLPARRAALGAGR